MALGGSDGDGSGGGSGPPAVHCGDCHSLRRQCDSQRRVSCEPQNTVVSDTNVSQCVCVCVCSIRSCMQECTHPFVAHHQTATTFCPSINLIVTGSRATFTTCSPRSSGSTVSIGPDRIPTLLGSSECHIRHTSASSRVHHHKEPVGAISLRDLRSFSDICTVAITFSRSMLLSV